MLASAAASAESNVAGMEELMVAVNAVYGPL